MFGDEEPAPEYPMLTLVVDRLLLANEGVTKKDFIPLYDRFDNIEAGTDAAAADAVIAKLRGRLVALHPTPLQVRFRDKRHSLWGHRLWNAAKYLTKRMDERLIDVRGKSVLELGAGLGVPTLAAYRNGAKVAVVTDYPDPDLLDIIALNLSENCTPSDVDADVVGAAPPPTPGRCAVEPLLWGKKEHIDHVMKTYTSGTGFDVVILSDILFNHVCNDDLADTLVQTLQRTPSAVGYCVFSHHRAYKQLPDLEFFDKCVARGLQYEQVDEQDYPMMFPDDRGPEEVRQPVKCYKITRRYDAGGPPLDLAQSSVDVVIQGTDLVQAYLAAALARRGLKVLHCDGNSHYGGLHGTFSLKELPERLLARSGVVQSPCVVVDRLADHEFGRAAEAGRFLVDILPSTFIANGEVIEQIVRSDMARTMEFQNLSGFFFVDATSQVITPVPLTRSDLFTTQQVGLSDKRRMMKFIKDVEPSLTEQLHAKNVSPADNVELQKAASRAAAVEAAAAFVKAAEGCPNITLSELLEKKYRLTGRALDILTLMRALDTPTSATTETAEGAPAAGLLHSVHLVRQLLTSVGVFGGSTPFLVPSYGASEMSQSMCRTAAVWGATYVLGRSVCRIAVDETKAAQYAVLSNGQYVRAKVIVAPEELVENDGLPVRRCDDWQSVLALERARAAGQAVRASGFAAEGLAAAAATDVVLSRVVLVASRAVFTWVDVTTGGSDPSSDDLSVPPVVMALTRSAGGHVVHLVQHSHNSNQTPSGKPYVIIHATAVGGSDGLTSLALHEFVCETFMAGEKPRLSITEDVLYMVHFTLSALHSVLGSQGASSEDRVIVDIPSETRHTHPYAIAEALKQHHTTEHDRHLLRHEGIDNSRSHTPLVELAADSDGTPAASASKHLCVVPVVTLRTTLLDDGQYMEAARRAYDKIVTTLCDGDRATEGHSDEFMERLPPIPTAE